MADPSDVEVRGYFPRHIVDVLDAIVQANPGSSRVDLMREVLASWCNRKSHEAILIVRVQKGNGSITESPRNVGGSRGRPENLSLSPQEVE